MRRDRVLVDRLAVAGERRALADDVEQRGPVPAPLRASASGVDPIASVWLNVTSVMRAVCSARST